LQAGYYIRRGKWAIADWRLIGMLGLGGLLQWGRRARSGRQGRGLLEMDGRG